MEMERENIIEAKGLSFDYDGEPVLDNVSFSVKKGEFSAIIGSNGTGKSTLLKLLLGELSPSAGEIYVWGQSVSRFKDWPRVGYVPQNSALNTGGFPATAEEIVRSSLYPQIGPLRLPGKRHKLMALEALAQMGVRELAGRMIGDMSGGQLQRVMIARALAGGCELMLLDEPSTGIDASSANTLYETLYALNRERGMTIIMVTHDVQRAAGYINRCLCLEDGSIVELDKEQLAHEIAHKHKHPGVC